MNNNEISNPKVEVPSGTELNEKDYIGCLLSTLKDMEKNYTIAMTEASNEQLYKKYEATFNKIASLQRETYEIMFQNGWYKLEKAPTDKINNKLNMLNTDYNGLK